MKNKWRICPDCSGEGKNSIHLGAVNPDDWSHDEWKSYLAGDYDRTCTTCKGSGKVTEDDLDAAAEREEDYKLFCRESGISPYH